ncbi:cysteine-rich receptor-like protein kinase [Trifolium pratense]|uniref:Cysteine-rich receptor-like protein kinase n=1 Tax=Trifolium pratense TaxID=57577 RepID=A0A2K3JK47_TRIPR|nr:cysteine-rich receptor-like protein kinase [Trifolium pratense]
MWRNVESGVRTPDHSNNVPGSYHLSYSYGGEPWGRWFGEHVVKRVGDVSDTFFWTDPWVDESPLCERFGRLFDLAETKRCTVAEMFSLGWGWKGRLGCGGDNKWQWQPDPDTGYTVRGAYQLLTAHVSVTLDVVENLIWHTQVPLKVSIFAWCLLRDRSRRPVTCSSLAVPLALFGR